jgi:FkbM family methyltransferase
MSNIIEFIINFVNSFYYFRIINKYLKKLNIQIVIDVGSHKGEFFLSLMKDIKTIKKTILVEPQNELLKHLFFIKNKLPKTKIDIEEYALGPKKGTREIKINSLSSTSTLAKINHKSKWFKFKNMLLIKNNKNAIVKKTVLIETLDNLIEKNNIKKIDLLKIDTEGFEHEVLQGAKKSLKLKKIKAIMIEKQLSTMYLNYNFKKVSKILEKNGFLLKKKFRFPLALFEDRIYTINQKLSK